MHGNRMENGGYQGLVAVIVQWVHRFSLTRWSVLWIDNSDGCIKYNCECT